MTDPIPTVAGLGDKQNFSLSGISFSRLKPFDAEIAAPKPDLYYGAQSAQIERRDTIQ